jgi:hypothetical protein
MPQIRWKNFHHIQPSGKPLAGQKLARMADLRPVAPPNPAEIDHKFNSAESWQCGSLIA